MSVPEAVEGDNPVGGGEAVDQLIEGGGAVRYSVAEDKEALAACSGLDPGEYVTPDRTNMTPPIYSTDN